MKIDYVFRHLDQSDFVRNFAQEHIEKILSRHQRDPNVMGVVKMEMENSPQHPGKNLYSCEIRVSSPVGSLIVKKRTSNMYEAIAEASSRLSKSLEKVKGRYKARRRRRYYIAEDELGFAPMPV
jgi:ribosomal subunit interface protein